jgi:hypothetical protein
MALRELEEHNMNPAIKAIALADDVSIVHALTFLYDELLRQKPTLQDELIQAQNELPKDEDVSSFLDYLDENVDKALEETASVSAARWLLVSAAENPQAVPFVRRCVEDWPDDGSMSAGKSLKLVTIGAVWLAFMATDISCKDGELIIRKRSIVPEEVKLTLPVLASKLELRMSAPDQDKGSAPHVQGSSSHPHR